ncbi:MAG: hypothetical protein R2867_13680 [Caldilineaceae bacterium]
MMRILQRLWAWLDDRTGLSALIGPIASHLVPRGSTWAYVFGSATLFTFLLQVVTGLRWPAPMFRRSAVPMRACNLLPIKHPLVTCYVGYTILARRR